MQGSYYSDKEQRYSDARSYLISRYPLTIFDKVQAKTMTKWNILCYHDFYQKFHTEWNNSTAVLLEIGGGPCIYPYISAAPYVSEIYHSDYTKSCRDEVVLWKNKDPSAYDWSPYFKYVVNTLEDEAGQHAVSVRQERLHRILTDVLYCDINTDVIVPAITFPVDIISCNYCLDFSCYSMETYLSALKNIFHMLKPCGFLVMLSGVGSTWCKLGGIKHYTPFTVYPEDIKEALEKVGFDICYMACKDKPLSERDITSDSKSELFVAAQKPSNDKEERDH